MFGKHHIYIDIDVGIDVYCICIVNVCPRVTTPPLVDLIFFSVMGIIIIWREWASVIMGSVVNGYSINFFWGEFCMLSFKSY
jgi:hypothetical protein